MTLITDDFGPVPERRMVSAGPVSPQEEAIERMQIGVFSRANARRSLAANLEAFAPVLHRRELMVDAPVGAEFGFGA